MVELKPHEQRVVAEYKELRERHARLYTFIASETFITLPEEDRELMIIQENLMDALSFVLARRIRRFSAATAGVPEAQAPSLAALEAELERLQTAAMNYAQSPAGYNPTANDRYAAMRDQRARVVQLLRAAVGVPRLDESQQKGGA